MSHIEATHEERVYQRGRRRERHKMKHKGTRRWPKKWDHALESSLALAVKRLSRPAYDESMSFRD